MSRGLGDVYKRQVKDKSSTPSFALGIVGMSVAALVAAAGASLRREEE